MPKGYVLKVLVLGQNPSKRGGTSKSLMRLAEWIEFLELKQFSFANVYDAYKVETASADPALNDYVRSYDRVIALGQTASRTLSAMGVSHFRMPHPSGLNRQLNDQKFVHEKLEACKNYLRGDI